jgi:hypothetical protein
LLTTDTGLDFINGTTRFEEGLGLFRDRQRRF